MVGREWWLEHDGRTIWRLVAHYRGDCGPGPGRGDPADRSGDPQPARQPGDIAGKSWYLAAKQCAEVPWAVIYLDLAEEIDAPVRLAIREVLLLAGLTMLPLIAALLMGRFLGGNMRGLVQSAHSIERIGDLGPARQSGIREIDVVQRALRRAAGIARERRETQQRLRENERRLLDAQRVVAVGWLASTIAHDFGNLIYAIRGNLELIARVAVDPQMRQQVTAATSLADEAGALMGNSPR